MQHRETELVVELNLFRIVQEALKNVEKHPQAKTVRLRIAVQGSCVALRIQDDGRGFNPAIGTAGKRKGHRIGLINMRERAVSLGGTYKLKAAPNNRTTLLVRVPCADLE